MRLEGVTPLLFSMLILPSKSEGRVPVLHGERFELFLSLGYPFYGYMGWRGELGKGI